jgi:hypothetical protein
LEAAVNSNSQKITRVIIDSAIKGPEEKERRRRAVTD